MSMFPEGPWLLDTGRPRRTTIVARTHASDPSAPQWVEIADVLDARSTRLLVGAPDMYDAIRQWLVGWDTNDEVEKGNGLRSMRAAVAKVEGRGQ